MFHSGTLRDILHITCSYRSLLHWGILWTMVVLSEFRYDVPKEKSRQLLGSGARGGASPAFLPTVKEWDKNEYTSYVYIYIYQIIIKQLWLKLSTTDGNKMNLWILFTYVFISSILHSLAEPILNELANIVSTQISPLCLLRAFLYKNIIQSNNNQVW